MRVLVIDNYDSFTYNLVEILKILKADITVCYNDLIDQQLLDQSQKILISPGPGLPQEAGNLIQTLKQVAGTKSVLGICLGHQAIGELFGARLLNLAKPCHGKNIEVKVVHEDPLFKDMGNSFKAGLYHSWVLDRSSLPPALKITACHNDEVMGIWHPGYNMRGLQFHPESYATPLGLKILDNWLSHC